MFQDDNTLLELRVAGLLSIAFLAACSEPRTPTQPTPANIVVYGVVFEHTMTGFRPLAGVPLRVIRGSGLDPVIVNVTSNADGTYAVAGTVNPEFVWIQVRPGFSYRAPCPPYSWFNGRLDVHVVSTALLSTAGVPASMARSDWAVSGLVTERVSGGVRPVPGAAVGLFEDSRSHPVDDNDSSADTVTNADGRYEICWVGNAEAGGPGEVRVRKDGYRTASQLVWAMSTVDFELVRD